MTSTLRSLWAEPRPPHAPRRVWRDWALVGVLVPTAVVEQLLRDDLVWSPLGLLVAVAVLVALLWRRTAPLLVVAVAFGLLSAMSLATLTVVQGMIGLNTTAAVVVLPYALARWGAGREVVVGLAVMVVSAVLGMAADFTGVGDAIAGMAFLLSPAAIGASVRYRSNAWLRDLEQVRLRERQQLARDLHDTVAHHVSAIAIQAQAGRTLAGSHPDRAAAALEVIEESASRTLAEMRKMVGVLRDADDADQRSPQQGVADIRRLARASGDWPRIDVELTGDLDDLSPSSGAALYRLAQESITNASRHARHATRISVQVDGQADSVRLTVVDDGDAGAGARGSTGFGLVGMTERAMLLGGTLEAGPRDGRGWTITAVLPKDGAGR